MRHVISLLFVLMDSSNGVDAHIDETAFLHRNGGKHHNPIRLHMNENETVFVRPSWDEYYLGIAEAVAARGECSRRQVGAVIVSNHAIIATGYNGAPAGYPSCLEGACPRARMETPPGTGYAATGCTAIHAEANAIIRAGRERCLGSTLYVTCPPCDLCTTLIAAAGIGKVVYPEILNAQRKEL